MGFFDRFRKPATVPAGFLVNAWPGVTDQPAMTRMDGGVWLVSTGPGGDDDGGALRALTEAIEGVVRRPLVPAELAYETILADLLLPARPATERVDSVVAWTLQPGSLAAWADDAERLAELCELFGRVERARGERGTIQVVFVPPEVASEMPWVLRLLASRGLEIRLLPADGKVLLEVTRPDGEIISALIGAVVRGLGGRSEPSPADALPARRPPRTAHPLMVAPRLRAILGDPADREPLDAYLAEHDLAYLVVGAIAHGKATAELEALEDGTSAMIAFPDTVSAQLLAGDRPLIVMHTPNLWSLLLDARLGLSLRARGAESVRVDLSHDDLQRIAVRRRTRPRPA